jgi:hypothetical protein
MGQRYNFVAKAPFVPALVTISDLVFSGRHGQQIATIAFLGMHHVVIEPIPDMQFSGANNVTGIFSDIEFIGEHDVTGIFSDLQFIGEHRVSYLTFSDMLFSGAFAFNQIISDMEFLGEHHVEGVAQFELYIGEDGPPDFDAAPAETFTVLSHTTATTLTDNVTSHLVTRYRNKYGIVCLNTEALLIELDASGDEVPTPPSGPEEMAIAPAADGAVNVTATYLYETDGTTNQGDIFAIWLTTDGADPLPDIDVPDETIEMVKVDGSARLDFTSGTFADGLTAKTIVRVRRTGPPAVFSTNTAIVSTTTQTDGPDDPGGATVTSGDAGG